ncbi:MAG: glycosyl hydrolase 108 family protein [Syntrophobacteraceae bacterium]
MTQDPRFAVAFEKVLVFEGGYVCDPDDSGGETKYGISKRAYPHVDIKSLTLQDAREIYYRDYWQAARCPEIKYFDMAVKLFELAVNAGVARAVRILQEAVVLLGGDLVVDGRIGPRTIQAVNEFRNQKALLCAVKFLQAQHYVLLNRPKYLAGWLIRAMS